MANRTKTISSTIAERIKSLRLNKNYTQKELAELLYKSESAIRMWELGKSEPDLSTTKRLAAIFGVSVDYLLGKDTEAQLLPDNIRPVQLKKFRMLGEIACGEPIWADEDFETYIEASANIQADFCLTARGDSMIGARIYDGDIVFIKEQPIVENGQVAAVIIENEATLKRWYYYPEKKKLILNPENPAYEPLVYIGEELEQVRCLGLAVCFNSKIK